MLGHMALFLLRSGHEPFIECLLYREPQEPSLCNPNGTPLGGLPSLSPGEVAETWPKSEQGWKTDSSDG